MIFVSVLQGGGGGGIDPSIEADFQANEIKSQLTDSKDKERGAGIAS